MRIKKLSIILIAPFLLGVILSLNANLQIAGAFKSKPPGFGDLKACEKLPYNASNFGSSERYGCYAKQLSNLVRKRGIKETVTAFRSYLETEDGKLLRGGRCHALGHEIGVSAVNSGLDSDEVLRECLNFCVPEKGTVPLEGLDFGCLNGAAHGYVLLTSSTEEIAEICDAADVPDSIKEGCYHGIGHGVSEFTNANIREGLKMCDTLETYDARYQCGHAVLMDPWIINSNPILPEDMVSFCTGLKEVYSESCLEFAGFLVYAKTHSPQEASDACRNIEGELGTLCRRRVGEAIFLKESNPSWVAKECSKIEGEGLNYCLNGANNASIDGPDGALGDFAFLVCGEVDDELKPQCFKEVGEMLERRYGEETRRKACGGLEKEKRDFCFNDAGV